MRILISHVTSNKAVCDELIIDVKSHWEIPTGNGYICNKALFEVILWIFCDLNPKLIVYLTGTQENSITQKSLPLEEHHDGS
jgi:hypothetical protein